MHGCDNSIIFILLRVIAKGLRTLFLSHFWHRLCETFFLYCDNMLSFPFEKKKCPKKEMRQNREKKTPLQTNLLKWTQNPTKRKTQRITSSYSVNNNKTSERKKNRYQKHSRINNHLQWIHFLRCQIHSEWCYVKYGKFVHRFYGSENLESKNKRNKEFNFPVKKTNVLERRYLSEK